MSKPSQSVNALCLFTVAPAIASAHALGAEQGVLAGIIHLVTSPDHLAPLLAVALLGLTVRKVVCRARSNRRS